MSLIEIIGKSGFTWLIAKIKSSLSTKVDKEDGKGLSTNDLTDDLKSSYDKAVEDVADIKAVGGEPNKIDSISVNGTTLSIDSNKNVNIETITSNDVKSQVEAYGYQTAENVETTIAGKGYQTAENVETTIAGKGYQTSAQVQSAINTALSNITGIDLQVVSSLPTTGTKGVIYLVAHSHSDEGDIYDEYVWVESNSSFEKIGNTDVDLSAYVKASDISIISESELEAMWNA